MPADKSNIGMGSRRQGNTEPDRTDDSNRSLDRATAGDQSADTEFQRGKESGAHGAEVPHKPIKPGTQSDLDDAGL